MTLKADRAKHIFEIQGKNLLGNKVNVIKLDGNCDGPFIINIRGENVVIANKDIQLSDRLKSCPGNIFFNFPDAKNLEITKSGTGALGLQGTILAPQAALHFTDDLVTGGVFANGITGDGQINFSKIEWPSAAEAATSKTEPAQVLAK
jgi:choice-of-anchor A domain-containing protein